jgi:hypothetical protein
MEKDDYSVENFVRIYNDDHGYFYQIGNDSDGFGGVELKYSEGQKGSELKSLLSCSAREALILAEQLKIIAENMLAEEEK